MEKHPSTIDAFYAKHPSFIWGPIALAMSVRALTTSVPVVVAYLDEMGATPYGFADAGIYTAFAILLSYAAHGWMCTHMEQKRQLQAYDRQKDMDKSTAAKRAAYKDKIAPEQEAVRTVAALLTSLVYAVFPFAPATTSWASFVAWTAALAIYWDAHFFVCHKVAHEHRSLYVFFHKLHHENKQPGPFNAYFVTYQSHVCLEQLVVLVAAACGLPRDVFTWTLWWGTLGTFVEHCGHDVDDIALPLLGKLGVTWGRLSTALSPWSLVLGGEAPAEHDWHHEKFTTNYALSFSYLDKLFGTYHPGRKAGDALKPTHHTTDKAGARDGLSEEAPVARPPSPVSPRHALREVSEENLRRVPKYRSMPLANLPAKGKFMAGDEAEEADWEDAPRYYAPAPCFCSGLEADEASD